MNSSSYAFIGALFILLWIYIFTKTVSSPDTDAMFDAELSELSGNMEVLQRLMDHEREELNRVREQLAEKRQREKQQLIHIVHARVDRSWKEPIPILVFACNRPTALRNHLDKLISLRPSAERFPIIVTQDCDNEDVRSTVASYGQKVQYIKHLSGEKANITIPQSHNQYAAYYRIARHYKLALNYVFNEKAYSSVVITEDDLDIADDFFEYFSATRYLLDSDPLLWCVSAWNDNGKAGSIDESDNAKLYRSDFFSGLGWMMASSLWKELDPVWPMGFWDDWMREPVRRKGRQCIRPEISRTGMTAEGKKGASKGQFFSKHLAKILVNHKPVNFTRINLDYLLQSNYDPWFDREVFVDSKLLGIAEVGPYTLNSGNRNTSIRVEYYDNIDYIQKADRLHIMHDFKAGVPRTAYKGVVSCFLNGVRVYLAPNRLVIKEYNPKWEVPSQFGE